MRLNLASGAVLSLAFGLVAGCTVKTAPAPPTASNRSSDQSLAPSSPRETATPTATSGSSWQPGRGEVQPQIKQAAVRAIVAAGNWENLGSGSISATEQRAASTGVSDATGTTIARLLARPTASSASTSVTYAQYGGLTARAASVMVLVEQVSVTDGLPEKRGMTIDVRLSLKGGDWVVADVVRTPPPSATRKATSGEQQLLENRRVRLPQAAVDDVRSGRISPSLIALLNRVGSKHTLDVTVFASGHPRNVFGTARVSNHTVGRGVDIWRIDGHVVADPDTPRALLREVMVAAGAAGATEVGGPFDVNGSRPGFFTNQVHRDHLHFGINPDRAPAKP